jgi:hypothetical protein
MTYEYIVGVARTLFLKATMNMPSNIAKAMGTTNTSMCTIEIICRVQ